MPLTTPQLVAPAVVAPSEKFDWSHLAFDLYPTNGYAKLVCTEGEWGEIEWVTEPYLKLHVGSVGLNYGASIFEGLKAFRQPNGQVKLFRPDENAVRLNHSAAIVSMPSVPSALFLDAVHLAVARNLALVPPHAPHGASGSMYIRPLYFASGANLILSPPAEFTLIVYVTPTGSLYGTAGSKAPAVDAIVVDTFDRAAPLGVGHAKLAGNYAPTFLHSKAAKQAGYAITLHLDSLTRTHIDEFSTSNFLAIAKRSSSDAQRVLVVPTSPSILGSITTKAIVEIAQGMGWKVERRAVAFQEVIDGGFEEVCACGTAAAITPIRSISYHIDPTTVSKISIGNGETAGEGFLAILATLTGVQSGVVEDTFGFTWPALGVDGTA